MEHDLAAGGSGGDALIPTPWRKVLRDLWANRMRMVLIVLTMGAGVFAAGTIGAAALTVQRQIPAQYQAIRPAHFLFNTSLIDAEMVDTIAALDGVAAAEGRHKLYTRILVNPDAGSTGSDTWRVLYLFGLADFDAQRVDKILPVSGAWPPPKGSLLMERGSLAYLSLKEGQEITLQTVQGQRYPLTISGVAQDLYHSPAFMEGNLYAYASADTLQFLDQTDRYNELYVRLTGEVANAGYVQAMKKEITRHLEWAGVVIYSTEQPKLDGYPTDFVTNTLVLLLTLLGTLVLVLGVLLVLSSMSALVAQQRRQIAVIKAVGGSTGQVMGIYLGMVAILGLLSSLAALPLSRLAASGLVVFISGMLNYDTRLVRFPPEMIALQVGLGGLLPVIAALAPVWSSARRSPALALSEYGGSQVWSGVRLLDWGLQAIPRLTRLELLALRNPFRNRSRLFFSLLMLALAGGSFIAVLNLYRALQQTVDSMLDLWQMDTMVALSKAYRLERLERYALQVPGVTAVEGWGFEMTRRLRPDGSESNPVFIYAAPPESPMLRPNILAGRWLRPGDSNAIVIGVGLLEVEPDLRLGREIVLKVGGKQQPFRVVGVCEMIGSQSAGYLTYIPLDSYNRLVHQKQRASMLVVKTTGDTPDQHRVVGAAVEQALKDAGVRVVSTVQMDDERLVIMASFRILIAVLLVMVALLALVGGLGLMGMMSLNVLERSREIGVIRAFGGSNGSVLRVVLLEGVAIGVMSWLLALLLAVPLTWLFCDLIGRSLLSVALGYQYSAGGALLWLGLVVGLSAFSSLWPAVNAVRLTVREVLSYE